MNEIRKNIIFLCIIFMCIIIIFLLGWLYSADRITMERNKTKIQNLTGQIQSATAGYDNALRESQYRLGIIEKQREDNRKLENRKQEFIKRTEYLFAELERTNRELDRFRKEREQRDRRIERGFRELGTAINELGETINEIEAPIAD